MHMVGLVGSIQQEHPHLDRRLQKDHHIDQAQVAVAGALHMDHLSTLEEHRKDPVEAVLEELHMDHSGGVQQEGAAHRILQMGRWPGVAEIGEELGLVVEHRTRRKDRLQEDPLVLQ